MAYSKEQFSNNSILTAVGEEIWKSDEAPAYPINAGEEKPRYTGTYMISRVRPATVYMARVSSQNNYGYSHPSEVFKFATRGAGMILMNFQDVFRIDKY